MEFLLVVIVMMLMGYAIASAEAKAVKASKLQDVVDIPKRCPPHAWRYHEIKDMEGNTVKWKLACDTCGPLKPIN